MTWIKDVVAFALCGCLLMPATADRWSAPPVKWTSKNGQFELVRDIGTSRPPKITLMDLRDKPKPVWSRLSPQKSSPYEVHISPDGRTVVLEDEWGSLGFGVTLAILGPSGKTLKTYQLADILPGSEILDSMHSISSIWWKLYGHSFFRANGCQFALISNAGTVRLFDLETGVRIRPSEAEAEVVRREATTIWRPKLNVPDEQYAAVRHLAVLKDADSVPKMLKLMRATKPKERAGFGYSLGLILGDDFSSEIENQIRESSDQAESWFDLFGDGPLARAAMARLIAEKPNLVETAGSRLFGLVGPDAVRKNPQWLSHQNKVIRSAALLSLAKAPTKADLPLLERALDDADETISLWAMRALIKLQPANLKETLARLAKKSTPMSQFEAGLELARLGDKKYQAKFVDSLKKTTKTGVRTYETYSSNFGDVCEVFAELNLPGTARLLGPYAKDKDEYWRIPANGALACIGDGPGRDRTREQARRGYFLDRWRAIDWLARAKDKGALPILNEALADEDPDVVSAARSAIAKIGF